MKAALDRNLCRCGSHNRMVRAVLRAAAEMAASMTEPAPSAAPKLPVSLAANPMLSSWVRFSAEGQVMVSPGKVEIGQGIVTALAQIAADELDVDIGRVQMIRASTAGSPNEGVTSGSLSVQQSGRAIRHVCAEIRQIFLTAASDRLGVGIDALDIKDGTMSGPGNVRTSYWELADEISLDREATPGAVPKSSAQRTLAGNSVQRVDIPDKVFARPRFIHDSALPGMLHGRVLRPEISGAKLAEPEGQDARVPSPAWSPSCATEISPASSAKPRTAPKPRSSAAQGRDLVGRRNAAR